jgi:hypothetical protein
VLARIWEEEDRDAGVADILVARKQPLRSSADKFTNKTSATFPKPV